MKITLKYIRTFLNVRDDRWTSTPKIIVRSMGVEEQIGYNLSNSNLSVRADINAINTQNKKISKKNGYRYTAYIYQKYYIL